MRKRQKTEKAPSTGRKILRGGFHYAGRCLDGGAINAAVVLRIGLKVLCLGRFKGDPAALVVGFRKGQIAVRSGDDDGLADAGGRSQPRSGGGSRS